MADDGNDLSQGHSGAFLPAEDRDLVERYARSAAQARRSMITMLITKGRSPAEIAEATGISVEDVVNEIEAAIAAARKIIHMVPEGPLFMTEFLARGISDVVSEILVICREGIEQAKLLDGDDKGKKHIYINNYLKTTFDVMDKYAERMSRFGLAVDRGSRKKQWGPGIKVGDQQQDAEDVTGQNFQERAVEAGFDLEKAQLAIVARAEGRKVAS